MAALQNARHEIFAQEIAKGTSNREAYKTAGYEAKSDAAADACASRLLSDARIAARVAELLNRGAQRAEVTVERVLDKLEAAFDMAKSIEQPATMVTAAMGQAKIAGLIIDRKEVGAPGDFDNMSTDELRKYIRERTEALGLGAPATANARGSGKARGLPH